MLEHIPSEKRRCHHCQMEKSCRDLVLSGACERWVNIKGQHPQTGEPLDRWGCVDDLNHILLLEIGNQTSKVSVELNVMRNDSAKAQSEQLTMAAIAVNKAREAVKDVMTEGVQPLLLEAVLRRQSPDNALLIGPSNDNPN